MLYVGPRIGRVLAAAARAMGASVVTSVPPDAAPPLIDVLVVAPAAMSRTRRRTMEQAVALARRWGVPTLIDASGAGRKASATAAVRNAIRLSVWPVISASEREAEALVSPRRSGRIRSRPGIPRLATALARDGGVTVVGETQVVSADRTRRLKIHLGAMDRLSYPAALRVAMLGTYLAVADRADFITVIALALMHLSLAAERAQEAAQGRRPIAAQMLRALAAVTAHDLHARMNQSARLAGI